MKPYMNSSYPTTGIGQGSKSNCDITDTLSEIPPIQKDINMMREKILGVNSLLDSLRRRLEVVMIPSTPTPKAPEENIKNRVANSSDLEEKLTEVYVEINNADSHINDMMNRLRL